MNLDLKVLSLDIKCSRLTISIQNVQSVGFVFTVDFMSQVFQFTVKRRKLIIITFQIVKLTFKVFLNR